MIVGRQSIRSVVILGERIGCCVDRKRKSKFANWANLAHIWVSQGVCRRIQAQSVFHFVVDEHKLLSVKH